ncbi:MAG: S41 family peptidase [Ignavibacteriaceae bacterium]
MKNGYLSAKLFHLFSISLLLSFQIVSCTQTTDPTLPIKTSEDAWREDIDFLSSELKTKHIDFLSLIPEEEFDKEINNIKASAGVLENYEIFIRLEKLLASIKVGHTSIRPGTAQKNYFLPILTYEFSDGLYITHADQQYTNLLGKKILKVGGKDISIVKDSLAKIIAYENAYHLKNFFALTFSFAEGLRYFGFINSFTEAELEIEGLGTVILKPFEANYLTFFSSFTHILSGKQTPYYLQDESSYYWFSYLEENNTLYLKYNRCRNMNSKSFAVFAEEVRECINSNDVEKFVLDVRNNSGGDLQVITPLSFIADSPINQPGKMFVIIGRGTYSAAFLNAIAFKQNTNTILVGEPTGGKPNFYADGATFTLPNSGLIVSYCKGFFESQIPNPDALYPDYPVEVTSQDYINGKDPVLQFILDFNQ